MKMYKIKKIQQSLSKKGFKKEEGDHTYLVFVNEGKETMVSTKLSHGSSEPGKDILSKVKGQLKFNSQTDFERFIDCKMSQMEYTNYLKEKGVINK